MKYRRPQVQVLAQRLQELPQFINVVTGPRQVGKTTLVGQAIENYGRLVVSTDAPGEQLHPEMAGFVPELRETPGASRDSRWLIHKWQRARAIFNQFRTRDAATPFVFVVDEIQKIPRWSDTVKGLWDEDRAAELGMGVVLLGSSPLLIQKGMTESLMGRFELMRIAHWSLPEIHQAFDTTLDEFIYFGGYPASYERQLIRDESRWRAYVLGSLVYPSIDTDILQMTRVDKPALLKQLFELGAGYSGQILALKKVKGQLDDAGNESTLADYLHLLGNAGLLRGLQKYHAGEARRRASPPKFNVLNTALMSSVTPYTFAQAKTDRSYWGRVVESVVGAHLCNTADFNESVGYWRESPHEVDFVIADAMRLVAIEVKSGAGSGKPSGLLAFRQKHPEAKILLVGTGGIALTEFLSYPLRHWLDVP